MSQHPSLLGSQKGKGHRSVFKRYEKLKILLEKDKWKEDANSIFKLPKIKSIRFKVKKEKAAKPEEEAAAAGAVPGQGASAAAAGPTAAASAKPGAAKPGAAKPAIEKQPPGKEKKAKG